MSKLLARLRIGRPSPSMIVAMLALVVAASGAAVAAIPNSDSEIHGCYLKRNGDLRVIDPAAGETCNPNKELAISWNQQGEPGEPGEDGEQGEPGNLALAGKSCPEGEAVTGFDTAGDLICSQGDGGGGGVIDDIDEDGVANGLDNCPFVSNTGQVDADADGLGDACDPTPNGPLNCDDGDPGTADFYDESRGSCTHVPMPGLGDLDGDGYSPLQGDCDDEDPSVNPGAVEVLDGKDTNCDGVLAFQTVGTDIGVCEMGFSYEQPDGTWGAPVGLVGPSAEIDNGLDDDCDGTIDEGL